MNKKLINEDIKNMKYLLGYKPGRVISEQDNDLDEEEIIELLMDTAKEIPQENYDDLFDWMNVIFSIVEDKLENRDIEYDDLRTDYDYVLMGMWDSSESDFDDEDEDNLFEQEEPETDRYMFFSNLEQIHRQTGIMLEKDPKMIQSILDNGHDWAQDHIATAKESIDQTFDFFMNEEKGEN